MKIIQLSLKWWSIKKVKETKSSSIIVIKTSLLFYEIYLTLLITIKIKETKSVDMSLPPPRAYKVYTDILFKYFDKVRIKLNN